MISRKRIGELIEKESGCYVLNDGNIGYVHLKLKYEPELYVNGKDGYILYIYCNDRKEYKEEIFDEDLFETEEEAEWHKEFGCIERTERLELPTYEWMQPKEGEQDVYYNFYNYNHELMGIRVTKQRITLYKSYRCSDLTSTVDIFDNTKENYTLACIKAKELFLGEKLDDNT